jgi:hypothetical protein
LSPSGGGRVRSELKEGEGLNVSSPYPLKRGISKVLRDCAEMELKPDSYWDVVLEE